MCTSCVLPMIENGIAAERSLACSADASSSASIGGVYTLIPCALITSRIYAKTINNESGGDSRGGSATYLLLEVGEIGRGERVGLGHDRDQVHTRAEALHDLDVEGLQSARYD